MELEKQNKINQAYWDSVISIQIIERIPDAKELSKDPYVKMLLDLNLEHFIIRAVKRMLASDILTVEQIAEMIGITTKSVLKVKKFVEESNI